VHGWTAYPESATGLRAVHVTYPANASSIGYITDAEKAPSGLTGAAFVAGTGIPNAAVMEVGDAVEYASQAGRVYVSTDFRKSFIYVNQLRSVKELRPKATSTIPKAGGYWIVGCGIFKISFLPCGF
jgi:hypothetical protein